MAIDTSSVTLQIVASLTLDFKGIIYSCNMFIVQATGACTIKLHSRKLRIFIISWSVCPWQAFPA
jgi:hypothetical protein